MNIGSENQKKVYWAAGLGLLALLLLARSLFSPSAPTSAAAPPPRAAAPIAASSRPAPSGKAPVLPSSVDPTLRYDLLKGSEDTKYEGKGRNIFVAAEEPPQPVASAMIHTPPPPQQPQEYVPPPPPPINLVFYGFASQSGEPKKVFLLEGDDIFVAGEGDIVDRRYKILRIMPMAIEVEDVLNNNRQQIPLRQGQG